MEDSQNNETLIQEMLRDAQKTEIPSELRENPIIHRGDEEMPAPMTVKEISGPGYVWIWDTRTFKKVPVLYYMLPSKLRQRRPDGSYRFTTTDPGKQPVRGTIKCMLHKDSPERAHYDELGFRVCIKDNITNDYQLKQHMRKKHPQEWAAIEEARKEKERQEDRELQRLLLTSKLPEAPIKEPEEEVRELYIKPEKAKPVKKKK